MNSQQEAILEERNDPASDTVELIPRGFWSYGGLKSLILKPVQEEAPSVMINGEKLDYLDTAGALLLLRRARKYSAQGEIVLTKFSEEASSLFKLVERTYVPLPEEKRESKEYPIAKLGRKTVNLLLYGKDLISFIGEVTVNIVALLKKPKNLRYRELFVQLESVCLNAVPIVCLVTLLIGIVVAYLFALQIQKYGASIFIVDGIGLAMCRELSPIIVAVVMAGRSGSAFTAHIGSMKINEEIDAITTLGLSPSQVLVLPRVIALVASLPLLVFLGDVVGILGGMIIASQYLDITATTFIARLHTVVPLHSFFAGLIKAPVFALFIAIIGCHMGLTVENNARSLGQNTTSTVVQSIVAVILLDAAFAVVFNELGI